MLEVKKLKDFMEERGIQEGEQFAMLPLTNWYMFDDCFGQIIGLFDGQELNENYIVLTESPFKLKFEDILEKYHFEDVDEIVERLEYLRSRMRKGIESACQDENIKFALSVMLDDLVCTAVSLGIMTATKDLNNRNKKRSKKNDRKRIRKNSKRIKKRAKSRHEEIDSKERQKSI